MSALHRIFFAVFFLLTTGAQAQTPSLGCKDPVIRQQAAAIQKHYQDQGFKVFRDAMVGMESMEFFPIVAELVRGHMYQIVFIGNTEASKMSMDVLDGRQTKIDRRTMSRNREQPNYIIMPFVPEKSDAYAFILMQKRKNQSVCGSFFIMSIESDKKKEAVIPYTTY